MTLFSAAALSLIPGPAFWPYFIGLAILLPGLALILRGEVQQAQGIDKAIVFGRLFLAVPMGVFAGDHFIAPHEIAGMVPSWIPFHLFWAWFVGIALTTAAVSIIVKRYSILSSTLLGTMLFLFVLLIHIPNVAANPGDRFFWAIVLRDTSFSAGAFAFALVQARKSPWVNSSRIVMLLRSVVGVAVLFFGVEHFPHPQFVPVIPLEGLLPSWIPGHAVLAYLTGTVLIVCGGCMIANWKARQASAWLGIFVFVIVLLIYVPIMLTKLSDIGGGLNYVADTLLFSGALLLIAGVCAPAAARPRWNDSAADEDFTLVRGRSA